MSSQNLHRNLQQLDRGIETCLEHNLQIPALVLLYSAIEIVGTLANEDPAAGSRKIFTAWVDKYLLKAKPLNCSAVDLFAARCALIHTFTSNASLIEEGKARRVFYAWGDAKATDLQRAIEQAERQAHFVAVHISDLFDGWRLGLQMFLQELESDPIRQAAVNARGSEFYADYPTSVYHPRSTPDSSQES
jgi:hypothetical protein